MCGAFVTFFRHCGNWLTRQWWSLPIALGFGQMNVAIWQSSLLISLKIQHSEDSWIHMESFNYHSLTFKDFKGILVPRLHDEELEHKAPTKSWLVRDWHETLINSLTHSLTHLFCCACWYIKKDDLEAPLVFFIQLVNASKTVKPFFEFPSPSLAATNSQKKLNMNGWTKNASHRIDGAKSRVRGNGQHSVHWRFAEQTPGKWDKGDAHSRVSLETNGKVDKI